MTHAATGAEPLRTYNCYEFTTPELAGVVGELLGRRTASARAKVPGLEAGRADIAPAGALILETVATTFGVERITFSEAALRDGVLVDTVGRMRVDGGAAPPRRRVAAQHPPARRALRRRPGALGARRPPRRRAVRRAGARCTASTQAAREYLEAGALLANVGLVVAHSKHHLHAYYVIRNSELAGLTDLEIEIIAQIARYHRKSEPKASHPEFAALDAPDQELVRALAGILRVAIGLDRSHRERVAAVRVELHAASGWSSSSSPSRTPTSASSCTPPTNANPSSRTSSPAASS